MPEADRTIGPYRVIAPIGAGGFATVYRAVDERLDDEVAIKVLADNHSLDPEIRERFVAEAQVLRRVDSQHVVRVYDIGETDTGQPYLVLDYARRGDLFTRATRARANGATPTDEETLRVAATLGKGLAAIHRQRVVHRDVTPGNLLIRTSGRHAAEAKSDEFLASEERLVLTDLGYAKDLALGTGLTVGGGTLGFNAPEQRIGAGRIDTRADIYAASAVMVWFITGETPKLETPDQWKAKLLGAGASAALADAICKGLAERPDDRQPTIETWLEEIESALQPAVFAEGTPARPSTDVASVAPAGRPSINPLVVAGVAAAAIVALVLIVVLSGGGPDVTNLGDGRVRVTEAVDAVSVSIVGPADIVVGGTAEFSAEVTGATSYTWFTPDGASYSNIPSVDLETRSAGSAKIRLVGTAGDGSTVEVAHTLQVHDAPSP